MELGETPDMTKVGDDSKFLGWLENSNCRSSPEFGACGKGLKFWLSLNPSVGLN